MVTGDGTEVRFEESRDETARVKGTFSVPTGASPRIPGNLVAFGNEITQQCVVIGPSLRVALGPSLRD